jgi:hypothetical protein
MPNNPNTLQDPHTVSDPDVWEMSEGFGLNLTDEASIPQEEMTSLRAEWIRSSQSGNPLFVVDEAGKIWRVSVDGTGKTISLYPLEVSYEIKPENGKTYTGPTAWADVEKDVPFYSAVPADMGVGDSSVEAHVSSATKPIWLRAVQRLTQNYEKLTRNPYRK